MQELVRRYHLGHDGLESDLVSDKIGKSTKIKVETQLMTYEEMQYDIDFLRKQKDMVQLTDDYDKRKKYRRMMRKEAARELTKLEEEEKRMKELQENNKMAKPCLFHLVKFTIDKLVRYFPSATCQLCWDDLLAKKKKRNSKNKPEIAYWMHWFHSAWIEEVWNKPPFNPDWPIDGCGEKLGNANNKTDKASVKTREKLYSQSEARRSEAEEIDNLFG